MRKTTLSNLALLGLSLTCGFSSVFAHTTYNNPGKVGIDLTGGWFQGAVDNGGYGIFKSDTTSAPPTGTLLKIQPEDDFGGSVALSYLFPMSPYKVSLSYWRIDSDSSAAESGLIGVTRIPSTFSIDTAAAVNSEVDFDNDIYRLVLGAAFHPDRCTTIVPKIGAAYIRIKNEQTTAYSGEDVAPAGSVFTIRDYSAFKGLGPTIGFDLDYKFYPHFSFFGDFIYTAFIGNIVASYSAANSDPALVTTNIDMVNDKMVVSFLQTELGLAYCYQTPSYSTKIMVGYSTATAIGSSENHGTFVDDVSDDLFVSSITNTAFHGPFARVSFEFDV